MLYRAATQRALRDPLMGTGNRIAMEQTLQREIDMSRRHRQPLSLLMLDIDHFKSVNDTHGHAAGDHVLREVAASIKQQLRNVEGSLRTVCCAAPIMRCTWPSAKGATGWRWRDKQQLAKQASCYRRADA